MQVEMTEVQELESIYCELHKDVHGVKARWITFTSVEEGRAAIARLEAELVIVMAEQREAEARAIVGFEQLVKNTIASGAKDRETAMRWIHLAEGTDGDPEYLCYAVGLPYGYFKRPVAVL